MTALGPAGLDDRAAASGPEPGTETVLAGPLQVVGLEGSFHDNVSGNRSGSRRTALGQGGLAVTEPAAPGPDPTRW
jgi:hypothetical protein